MPPLLTQLLGMVNVDDFSCSFEAPVAVHLIDLRPCFTVLGSAETLSVPEDDGMS